MQGNPIPALRYSWRTMSANSSTRCADPIAASPGVSGHCENGPAIIWVRGCRRSGDADPRRTSPESPAGAGVPPAEPRCAMLRKTGRRAAIPTMLKWLTPASISSRSERPPKTGDPTPVRRLTAPPWCGTSDPPCRPGSAGITDRWFVARPAMRCPGRVVRHGWLPNGRGIAEGRFDLHGSSPVAIGSANGTSRPFQVAG